MNTSQLNNYEIKLFTNIHKSQLPKRKKVFSRKGLFYKYISFKKIIIKSIIEKSKEILDFFSKINYDLSKYYIEFQHRNCGFEKKCRRTFPWHVDQDGPMHCKVYSIIFYIRKDKGVKGGGLEYKIKGNKYMQYIKEGDIVCFDGNILHRPEICYGIGCRDSIVVFIKKTK